eukprot:Nitzschia sp. Nitz4//scaffold228_size32365//24691//27129//NITZ4_007909-RA/size32365-processed-gene-0.33-mRNA-1//1//CDS//3329542828//5469//frame0
MADTSSTRVCIKNLPPTATEQDVKEHLKETSKQPIDITDCKVLKNAKGKSRKVAFVGFRHEHQAKYVVDTFHRTFMRMCRLAVEPAMRKKDEQPIATGETEKRDNKEAPKSKVASSHREEIAQIVGGSGSKAKFWANDEEAPVLETEEHVDDMDGAASDSDDSDSSSSSDDEEMSDNEKVHPVKSKVSSTNADLDFLRSKQKTTEDLEDDTSVHSDAVPDDGNKDDATSDSDTSDSDDSDEAPSTNETAGGKSKSSEKQEDEKDDDDGEHDDAKANLSQSRLFIRNLPFGTTEEELDEYFSSIGTIIECHIPVDDQKRNKGFAFVQYASAADALTARQRLDKVDFQGRLLHILPARPSPEATTSTNEENLTWKQRQELKRKERDTSTKTGESAKGWSASFVRGDAVVDSLADRLGLGKGDLLGVKDKLSSGDAAVRLALGETQIIEENREYFRQHGVDMEALVGFSTAGANADPAAPVTRSKTSILVKNLPFDTKVEELNKLFQLSDENITILLPPSRTIALVQYGHSTDAKKAFKKLAYRRFKHVPIYLEWAPVSATISGDKGAASSGKAKSIDDARKEATVLEDEIRDADIPVGPTATIHIKNLNFSTSEETVQQLVEKHVGKVISVRIPKKVGAVTKEGEQPHLMSMGYGFVELDSVSAAQKAIKVLNGKLVEGHDWKVSISSSSAQGKSAAPPPNVQGGKPTKLIVRNIAFQATRTELLKLFGTFGQLRRIRLPKKFDGSHRGFAFVEFLTHKEALAAMTSLSRTHLYGRHLVLEWATDDDQDVERLREKATKDVSSSGPPNKKIRFN